MTGQPAPMQSPVHAHGQIFTSHWRTLPHKGCAALSTGSACIAAHVLWKTMCCRPRPGTTAVPTAWTNFHHTLRTLVAQGLRDLIHNFFVHCRTRIVENRGTAADGLVLPRLAGCRNGYAIPAARRVNDDAHVLEFHPRLRTQLPGQIFATFRKPLCRKGREPLSTGSACTATHALWKTAAPDQARRARHPIRR